jgi:hypothetical protein
MILLHRAPPPLPKATHRGELAKAHPNMPDDLINKIHHNMMKNAGKTLL